MEENITNVVDQAEEALVTAAENLDKAIAEQTATQLTPVQPVVQQQPNHGTKNFLIGAGLTLGGGAIGFAIDRWVLPAVEKKIAEAKMKHAAKKAAKKAKAEAKKAAKENKPAGTTANAPATDGIDPLTVDATIE